MTKHLFSLRCIIAFLFACSSALFCSVDTYAVEISNVPVKVEFKRLSQYYLLHEREQDIEQEEYQLISDDVNYYGVVNASVQWPEKIGSVDITSVCDSIKVFISGNKDLSIDSALKNFASNSDEAEIYILQPVTPDDKKKDCIDVFSHSLDVSIISLSEDLIVVKCVKFRESFGGHPGYHSSYMMFSLKDNVARHLTLSDLFVPNSDQRLKNAIASALMKKYNVDSISALNDEGVFFGSPVLTSDISITDSEIVFHYDPYEIGYHPMEFIDVAIPYGEILDLLTPTARSLFYDSLLIDEMR